MTKKEIKDLSSEEKIDYNRLRLDVLKLLADERNISSNGTKDDIIKKLILDDDNKYIRDTIHEKSDNGYNIGIDLKNRQHILDISKLIEKQEAKCLNRFSDDRIWYWSPQKLM